MIATNGDGGPSVCWRINNRGRGGGGVTGPLHCSATVTASFCGLLADVQNKLSEMKANRGKLRQGRYQWRSRAERTLID
jgi:hypothetical protein